MAEAALGLGANLGDKRGAIAEALTRIGAGGTRVIRRSADYRTEPWGFTEQDWFVNACALVETKLRPLELLDACLKVEQAMGRTREIKWGPRVIDIDLLAYDDLTLKHDRLTLPHPHVLERAFVLVPLAEIAPDLTIGGVRVRDALAKLDASGVERMPERD